MSRTPAELLALAHCDVYRPVGGDALAWAAWQAATAAQSAEIERLRAALSEINNIMCLPREPHWSYRNTITTNKNRVKELCRVGIKEKP